MDTTIKVLMGVPSKKLKMGGITTHVPDLVKYFEKENRYDIRTFDYGSKVDGGSLVNKKESLFKKGINLIDVFTRFTYKVFIYRPHIIHINTAFDKRSLIRDIPFSVFCFLFNQKLIFKIHGSSNLVYTQHKFYRFLVKLFFLGAKKVGVLSEIEKNEFISKFGNFKKLVVVKNIVVQREVVRKTFFKKDPFKIYALFISRIVRGKGLKDVIQALPIILKRYSNFVLVVAGDGPDLTACKEQAIQLDVMDSIIWLGFIPIDEVSALILSCDIFLFPSHFPEGMPMSLVEALKYGIPLITTKVRFAVNYLSENDNCLFINAGDIEDLSNKVCDLISSEELQNRMKTHNPKIVEDFSSTKVGVEFEHIYQQMLDN